MIYRNIFPLTGNGKYICKGNHFLCKTVPNAKDLQKSHTLEICIIGKKRKIPVPCFHNKFELGKKKTIFTVILAAAFP